jgi:uncharacterized membrane protein
VRRAYQFIKNTTVAGLFLLLPIVLIVKLLVEVVHLAQKASPPILALLPKQIVTDPKFPLLFAGLVVLIACFLAGLVMRLALAQKIGGWIERHLLYPIPGYTAIRSLTRGLAGLSDSSAFKAAALTSPDGGSVLVYLIEDHGDGLATVMIPSAPTPMAGSIKIVPRDRVHLLNVRISTVARVLTQCGVGAQALLRKEKQT